MRFSNKNLILLADAVSWKDTAGVEYSFVHNSVLMIPPSKKRLIFAGPGLHYKGESKSVSSTYEMFTGRKNRRGIYTINFPSDLDLLGNSSAIAYRSDKYNGGGDGTMAEYEHQWENETKVFCRGDFFVFVNPKMKLTSHGIEN